MVSGVYMLTLGDTIGGWIIAGPIITIVVVGWSNSGASSAMVDAYYDS
jgi:hypothetical protein